MTNFQLGCGIEGLERMPALSIDLTVTSPPYGDIRRYGGHPWYRSLCLALIDELWRVTKPGGVVCWVEGDAVIKRRKHCGYTGEIHRNAIHFLDNGFQKWDELVTGSKGYSFCSSLRYRRPLQHVFVFSKGRPKTIDLQTRPNKTAGMKTGRGERNYDGSFRQRERYVVPARGTRGTIWLYPSGNHTEKPYRHVPHGATFHNHLARDLIKSYSRRGGLVCDPMAGLATTGKWAVLLQRNFVGFEIHEPFWRWGQRRLSEARMELLRASRT